MSAYKIMLCLGIVAMIVVTIMRKKRYNLTTLKSVLFAITLTVVGVAGCKLLYITENVEVVKNQGLTFGGFSFYGAVFLIPICFLLIGKLFGMRPLRAVDCCAIGVAIMIALMRIGCFVDGCCGAIPIELFNKQVILPVQLIESIFDFIILMVLWHFEDENIASGRLYSIFMLAYAGMRFCIEFLRDTPKDLLYLSRGQWYSIAAIVLAITHICIYRRVCLRKSSEKKNSNRERGVM